MARKRKTYDVDALRQRVNVILADPSSEKTSRMTVTTLLESVLMETGNYKGFGNIAWLNGGCDRWLKDGRPQDLAPYLEDETMRIYW